MKYFSTEAPMLSKSPAYYSILLALKAKSYGRPPDLQTFKVAVSVMKQFGIQHRMGLGKP